MSYEKLANAVKYVRWMQERDLDVFAVVTSKKGFGKSSTLIQFVRKIIAMYGLSCAACGGEWVYTGRTIGVKGLDLNTVWEPCPHCKNKNRSLIGPTQTLDLDKYTGWDYEDVREKIMNLPPYSPLMLDEAVRFMMGEDWMRSESKDMKKLFTQMRTKHLAVFGAIPKFQWMDSKYRNDMTTFWIRILKRSFVVLVQPDLGEAEDPWHMKEFQKILGHYDYHTDAERLYKVADRLVAKHPCVFDHFRIPPVPDELYAKYLRLRDKKAYEEKVEDVDKKDLGKVIIYHLSENWDYFLEQILKTSSKRPTQKLIATVLCKHPLPDREPILNQSSVGHYIKDVQRIVRNNSP